MTPTHVDDLRHPVSIIVPIYRDLQATRNCLESVLNCDLPESASVTMIDDNSPEQELSTYCRELEEKTAFRLLRNDRNMGFVATANRGMSVDPQADIILLNSDTVVSGDWVQRLQRCAYQDPNTGTVTPFSNNGTICSYPVFLLSNDLPEQWSAAELDQVFQSANAGTYAEIPTAVGFCMYIKRSCLEQTGLLDEANFGLGYGEECDFSLRAASLGWKNMIAGDVFVYHEGGASFATESAQRKRQADRVIDEIHPEYHQLVSDFIQRDPLYDLRKNVDARRLAQNPADSVNILEEHQCYSQSILRHVSECRKDLAAEQKQRTQLEQILNDCRDQFEETDRALTQAQEIVEGLNEDLDKSRLYAQDLLRHIRNMEESRSWRYTAWMRRKEG